MRTGAMYGKLIYTYSSLDYNTSVRSINRRKEHCTHLMQSYYLQGGTQHTIKKRETSAREPLMSQIIL
jgi:hypothetical protein